LVGEIEKLQTRYDQEVKKNKSNQQSIQSLTDKFQAYLAQISELNEQISWYRNYKAEADDQIR